MPFELGLAVALARLTSGAESNHGFALFEARPFRLQRSLSDMNGFDPTIHDGTRDGAVRCALEIFVDAAPADVRTARLLADELARVSRKLKRDHGVRNVFGRSVFTDLLAAAMLLRSRNRRDLRWLS